MIAINSDVTVSGKIIGWISDYKDEQGNEHITYSVTLPSGKCIRIDESDVKSYHPYQAPPETDERRGQ